MAVTSVPPLTRRSVLGVALFSAIAIQPLTASPTLAANGGSIPQTLTFTIGV